MRKLIITSFLSLFLLSGIVVSCSSDDGNLKPKPDPELPEVPVTPTEPEEETYPNYSDIPIDKRLPYVNPNIKQGPNKNVAPNTQNPTGFAHKVLIEDFTGAWCQFCPLVAFDIEKLEAEKATMIEAIAIHNSYPNTKLSDGSYDPFDFNPTARRKFEQKFKIQGYPAAFVNRVHDFRAKPKSVEESHLAVSPIGIKISSKLGKTTGSVDVSVKFSEDFNQELKYVVYIVEDHIIFRQSNNTPYYTPKQGWVEDFEHNNIVRAIPLGFEGSTIPSSNTSKNSEFTQTDLAVSYESLRTKSLRVVVIITDASGKALNVQSAKANSTQDYIPL